MKNPFTIAAILAIIFGFGFAVWNAVAVTGRLPVRPYTAVERTVSAKTGEQTGLLTTFIRSDGSQAQKAGDLHLIWDVTEKTETVIDTRAGVYVVAPLLASRIPNFVAKPDDCAVFFRSPAGPRKVVCTPTAERAFGRPVTKVSVERDETTPAELQHSEVLFAVREGEPSPAEFRVPPGAMRVRNFAEYHRASAAARSHPFTEDEAAAALERWKNVVNRARADGDTRFSY